MLVAFDNFFISRNNIYIEHIIPVRIAFVGPRGAKAVPATFQVNRSWTLKPKLGESVADGKRQTLSTAEASGRAPP